MHFTLLLILLEGGIGARPTELATAARQREFWNGSVTYTRHFFASDLPDVHMRAQFTPREYLSVSRYKMRNGDSYETHVLRSEDGWIASHGNAFAAVTLTSEAPASPLHDVRSLGLHAWGLTGSTPAECFADSDGADYTLRRQGDQIVVTCRKGDDPHSPATVFWLDPGRGGSVTRCQHVVGDEVLAEAVTNLAEYNGTWFPESVLFFQKDFDAGQSPSSIVKFSEVRVNTPDLPDRLTPADIGVEIGTNIIDLRGPRSELKLWDGQKIDTFQSVGRRIKSGEIKLGPRFVRGMEEQRISNQASALSSAARFGMEFDLSKLSEWERYVLAFIQHYKLNQDQTSKAWTIHAQCKERAQTLLASKSEVIAQLRLKEIRLAELPTDVDRRPLVEELLRARAETFKEVSVIFESELVPRLDALLTRKQTALVQTSQPSGK